jgi:Ca2+-binding RTX toxin-like protein
MEGGMGNDTLLGGDGNDVIDEDGYAVKSGFGDDWLDGGTGNDTLFSGDGNDVLLGATGADYLYAEDGNDSLDGGADNDYLEGDMGNDTLLGGDGNDTLDEDGYGVRLGYGNDWLDGGTGNDTLFSGDGDDMLLGGAGNDILYAEQGNDTLNGGAGMDTLSGGVGADRFVFDAASSQDNSSDVLLDFMASEGDQIVFDHAFFKQLEGKADLTQHIRQYSAPSIGGDDYIVYDNLTGHLYYDATGLGDLDALLIATLQTKPLTMAANQFAVL